MGTWHKCMYNDNKSCLTTCKGTVKATNKKIQKYIHITRLQGWSTPPLPLLLHTYTHLRTLWPVYQWFSIQFVQLLLYLLPITKFFFIFLFFFKSESPHLTSQIIDECYSSPLAWRRCSRSDTISISFLANEIKQIDNIKKCSHVVH